MGSFVGIVGFVISQGTYKMIFHYQEPERSPAYYSPLLTHFS